VAQSAAHVAHHYDELEQLQGSFSGVFVAVQPEAVVQVFAPEGAVKGVEFVVVVGDVGCTLGYLGRDHRDLQPLRLPVYGSAAPDAGRCDRR
jgi:ABC-type lipopolysaccharide export system ATPase subunit